MSKNFKILGVIVLIVAAFIFGAQKNSTKKGVVTNTSTTYPNGKPPISPFKPNDPFVSDGMKKYTDNKYHISFVYPADSDLSVYSEKNFYYITLFNNNDKSYINFWPVGGVGQGPYCEITHGPEPVTKNFSYKSFVGEETTAYDGTYHCVRAKDSKFNVSIEEGQNYLKTNHSLNVLGSFED